MNTSSIKTEQTPSQTEKKTETTKRLNPAFFLGLSFILAAGLSFAVPQLQPVFAAYIVLAGLILLLISLRQQDLLRKLRSDDGSHHKAALSADRLLVTLRSSLDKTRLLQNELAGEIVNSITSVSKINQNASSVLSSVDVFKEEFGQTAKAFTDIDKAIGELESGILGSAAATEQTSAAVEEISASINRINEESVLRYKEIKNLGQLTRQGQQEMKNTHELFTHLSENIGDLEGFIAVIEDIADRTSLLSMNAAIQAAHAGEAGKGFAVVADEIRKLAESSSQNADKISKRLKSLIDVIKDAEDASNKTSSILADTEKKVELASESFLHIQEGTGELSLGGQEILSAVTSLRDSAHAMKSNVQHVKESSSSLESQVQRLNTESQEIHLQVEEVQKNAAQINMNSLTVSQASLAQIDASHQLKDKSFEPSLQEELNPIVLDMVSMVSRVRATLDKQLSLNSRQAGDDSKSLLSQWLKKPQAKQIFGKDHFDTLSQMTRQYYANASAALEAFEKKDRPRAERLLNDLAEHAAKITKKLHELSKAASSKNASVQFMSWSDSLSVHNETVDSEHKELIRLINLLSDAIQQGKSKSVMSSVLDDLINYTDYHFSDEEKLFMPSDYPYKDAHIKQHQGFVKKIQDLKEAYSSGQAVLGTETLAFLKDWLLNHIKGTDQGYARYLK